MENNPNTGASRDRDEKRPASGNAGQNAEQNKGTGQKADTNNRNTMPPPVANKAENRPGSQNQGAQNSQNEEADEETLETEDSDTEEENSGGQKQAQSSTRNRA